MSDEIDLVIDTRELEEALGKLAVRVRGQIMREALQAGVYVMLEALVECAPERTDDAEMPEELFPLPAGLLKEFMTTEVQVPGDSIRSGKGYSQVQKPRVKVGVQATPPVNAPARVGYWQNNGWILTRHASRSNPNGKRGKRGWKAGGQIRPIPGKHFFEKAFDISAQASVDAFLGVLQSRIFDETEGISYPENNSRDVDFG